MLEIKKWNDYSLEEQSELLNHWWHYYGNIIFTLDELEQFNELIKKDSHKVLELAVANFIIGQSTQSLIQAMRVNKVDNLMNALPSLENNDDEEFKAMYTKVENDLISILVESYNNPEPSIPMEPEVAKEQIKDIVLRNNLNN